MRWGGRVSLAFVGYALLTAMGPDVDQLVPGVAANGLTHSLLFVVVVALVFGAAFSVVAEPVLTRWWVEDERRLPERWTMYTFAASALFVGGTSHLVADAVSPTAANDPLTPFWPALETTVAIDVVQMFTTPAWTVSFLVIALTAHVGLFLVDRG